MKLLSQFILLATILGSSLFPLLPLYPVAAQLLLAQATPKSNGTATTGGGHIAFNAPRPVSKGTGRTREGHIGMGECPTVSPLLTGLVPESAVEGREGLFYTEGQTVSAHPTIWFYVPYGKGIPADFSLQDSQGNEVYTVSVNLPANPGIMSVSIPSTGAPLQLNELYRWQLQVECSQPAIQVSGWIQRVSRSGDLEEKMKTANQPQQKAAIYAAQGIWYDVVNVLAKELQKNPGNVVVKEQWIILLNQVGLQNMTSIPFAK